MPATDHAFLAPNGLPTRLDAFRGKVAVVNLWAMWCPPCRLEMPTLARLADAYADNPDVAVVVVNVDVGDLAPARAFLADHAPLAFYSDPKFKMPFEFGAKGGMPQTAIIDRQGRVRAVMTGEADWNTPEARALIDALLVEPEPKSAGLDAVQLSSDFGPAIPGA
ncbi:TlpA family protein disulfide reductase [Brevundimonas sp. VNH65]|uniref:TlpA family protein disulfide reductase n=1 Tax=Brevundimonas sp. VNH65 TaxID=3400917 RepID=UPI003C0A6DD3